MLDVLPMFASCKIVQEPIEFYLAYAFHFGFFVCFLLLFGDVSTYRMLYVNKNKISV
jgi:hypothetical protein